MPLDRKFFNAISRMAERETRAMARRMERLLREQTRMVAAEIKAGRKLPDILHGMKRLWLERSDDLKLPWAIRYAVDGYILTGGLMGKSALVSAAETRLLEMSQANGKGNLIGFGDEEIIANHLRSNVSRWIRETSEIETATTARKFEKIYQDSLKGWTDKETGKWRNLTPAETANFILSENLADIPARATLMARTMTNWGYNEGANKLYADEGVAQIEWMTAEDEVTCEFCGMMDGKVVGTQEKYFNKGETMTGSEGGLLEMGLDVDHPPLHPHCRCCLLPVL